MEMRFRAKFGSLGWSSAGSACLVAILWLSGLRHGATPVFAFSFLLLLSMAMQRILFHIFIYWDVESDCLRERRFWNTKEIPWREVTHIGSWVPNQPASDFLEIDFDRQMPMSERGSIVANPEDRGGFISALRRFAPQAEFEV